MLVLLIFFLSGYDLKKASDGSDFTIYSQSTVQKLGPPLALRVSSYIALCLYHS